MAVVDWIIGVSVWLDGVGVDMTAVELVGVVSVVGVEWGCDQGVWCLKS